MAVVWVLVTITACACAKKPAAVSALFSSLGGSDSQLEAFEKQAKQHPNDPVVLSQLAQLYARDGRIQESLQSYLKAAKHAEGEQDLYGILDRIGQLGSEIGSCPAAGPASFPQSPEDCLPRHLFTEFKPTRDEIQSEMHFTTPFWTFALAKPDRLAELIASEPSAVDIISNKRVSYQRPQLDGNTAVSVHEPIILDIEAAIKQSVLPEISACVGTSNLTIQFVDAAIHRLDTHGWQQPMRNNDGSSFSGVLALSRSESKLSSNFVYFQDPRPAALMFTAPKWFQNGSPRPWEISAPQAIVFPSYLHYLALANQDRRAERSFLHFSFNVAAPEAASSLSLAGCFDGKSPTSPDDPSPRRWSTQIFRKALSASVLKTFNPALREYVLKLEKTEPSVRKSNKGGWQSVTDLFERGVPEVAKLRTHVYEAIAQYIRDDSFLPPVLRLPKTGTLEIDINFAWAGVNRRGHFNAPHMHPYAEVSGVFYVDAAQTEGHIFHIDPRVGAHTFVVRGNSTTSQSLQREFLRTRVSTGLIVLFPSWLEHFVDPHTTDEPRIAIAFNARVQHVFHQSDGHRLKFKIPSRHSK